MATTPSNYKNLYLLVSLTVFILCLQACTSIKETSKEASKQASSFDAKQMTAFFDAEKLRLSNSSNAIRAYMDFVGKYPKNATGHYNLSRAYYAKRQWESATTHADECVKLAPGNKHFWEYNARVWSMANNPQKTEFAYNQLLKLEPENIDFIYNQIWFYAKNKQYEKSLKIIDKTQARFGVDEDLIMLKKSIFLNQGKTDQAIKELEFLSSRNKSNPEYLIEAIDIYRQQNQNDKADLLYKKLQNEYPNNPLALIALTEYYQSLNIPALADSFMLQVLHNENLELSTRIGLIMPSIRSIQANSKDSSFALKTLAMTRALQEKNMTNKEINMIHSDVLYLAGKKKEALHSYNYLLSLDTTNFDVWDKLISIHLQEEDFDSVIHVSEKCSKQFPSRALPHYYIGISHQLQKRHELAIMPLSKALTLSNSKELSGQIYSTLGESYNAIKSYTLSDSCYREAIKLNPNDATSLNNFAYYLSLRNVQLDEAESMSKKSLELEPENSSFLDTYGWILYQKGSFQEAKNYITKAAQFDMTQSDATIYEHLGDVYQKLNDETNALLNWKKALEIDKNNQRIKQKINDIK